MTPVSRIVITRMPEIPSSCCVCVCVWEHVSRGLNIHEHTGVTIMEIRQRSKAWWSKGDTADMTVVQSEATSGRALRSNRCSLETQSVMILKNPKQERHFRLSITTHPHAELHCRYQWPPEQSLLGRLHPLIQARGDPDHMWLHCTVHVTKHLVFSVMSLKCINNLLLMRLPALSFVSYLN